VLFLSAKNAASESTFDFLRKSLSIAPNLHEEIVLHLLLLSSCLSITNSHLNCVKAKLGGAMQAFKILKLLPEVISVDLPKIIFFKLSEPTFI
jgi:hypothetical protein